MAKDFEKMEDSNLSINSSIHEVSNPQRRQFVQVLAWMYIFSAANPVLAMKPKSAEKNKDINRLRFQAMPPSVEDFVQVPTDYSFNVLAAWGEPVGIAGNMPAYRADASNTASEQAVQMGMHHDGLVFFPLNKVIHSDFSELVFLVAFVVGSGVVPVSKPPNNMEVKNEAIIFLFFKE